MTEREATDAVIENKKIKFGSITGDIRALFYTRSPEHKLCAIIQEDHPSNTLSICERIGELELA